MAAIKQEMPPAASCLFDSGSMQIPLPASHLAPGLDGGIELPKLVREVQSYVSLSSANGGRLQRVNSPGSLTPPRVGSLCIAKTELTRVSNACNDESALACGQETGGVCNDSVHYVNVSNLRPVHNQTTITQQCSNCVSSMDNSESKACSHLKTKHTRSYSSDDVHQQTPSSRRRILTEVEKNLTFRPKLNEYSLKIAARNSRNSVPVVHRLLEARKSVPTYQDPRLTFAPKLNALSVKLAQERNARMPEVQTKMLQLAESRKSEALSQYTFKPQVSRRSQRIVLSLGSNFQTRQQTHLERKRMKEMDSAYKAPPSTQFSKSRRIIKLIPRFPQPVSHKSDEHYHDLTSLDNNDTVSTTSNNASIVHTGTDHASSPTSSESPSHSPVTQRRRTHHSNKPSSVTAPTVHLKRKRARSAGVSRSKPVAPPRKEGGRGNLKCRSREMSNEEEKLLSRPFFKLTDGEKMKRIKIGAERLRKSKKVFLICGTYRRIRKCLRRRGWVELDYQKFLQNHPPNRGVHPSTPGKKTGTDQSVRSGGKSEGGNSVGGGDSDNDDDDGAGNDSEGNVSEDEYSDEEEYQFLSRAVRNCTPYFVWTLKKDDIIYHSLNKETLVNHFIGSSSFTTKVGICTHLRNVLWYGDTHPDTFFPRCYLLSSNEDKLAFIDDYRLTAALCVLKRLPTQYTTTEPPPQVKDPAPTDESSTSQSSTSQSSTSSTESSDQSMTSSLSSPVIPEEAVQLALKAAKAFLSSLEHDDIEGSQHQLCPKLRESEWETLIKYFYTMVFENGKVYCSTYMISKVNDVLQEVESHFPQLHMDGCRNVWIVKPGAKSRGRGIMCMERLESILELVSSSVLRNEGKWVIQKYIERPLLVSDTKFDIRQWFLVTDWNPLTMWMYKESYIRFSSQKYTLDDLDQSIHLCNNSVQKNYENTSSRDSLLPAENMWDSEQFKQYLSSIGESTLWESVVYPEMKQALIRVLQVCQNETEHRKNSFELYGADFMISSDYRPWLIEINCSPSMEASTEVTARLCKQVLEDTLKVVVDRREDKECDIGMFELAYKQPKLDLPSYVGVQLCVQGSSIPKPRSFIQLQKKPSIVRATINTSSPSNMCILPSNSLTKSNTTTTTGNPPKNERSHNIARPPKGTDSRLQSRAKSRSAESRRVSIVEIDCKLPEMRVC